METKDYWELFRDTGEPLAWLLCRAQEREKAKQNGKPRVSPQETRS